MPADGATAAPFHHDGLGRSRFKGQLAKIVQPFAAVKKSPGLQARSVLPPDGDLKFMKCYRAHEIWEDFMGQHSRLPGAAVPAFVQLLASLAMLALGAAGASAEDIYPSRPVRIVVSFSAGGPTDIVARVMGAKLGDLLGQQFVVENKVGAGGNIGADLVAKAAPDGYTLLMATVSTHAINPGLYKKIPYDPVRDFVAVAQIGVTPTLLSVNPSVPATDVKSLIALVKQNPGKFTYGSSGLGSILHLCGEQFKALAGGLNIVHVPYRGSAPMMSDLVAGQISMAFDATPTAMPQAQVGAIRAVGAGMARRMRAMPELPTLQEQGLKGFECYTWNAILAPAGTPQPIVDRLNAAINEALAEPAVIKRLEEAGIDPTPGSTPEQAAAFVKAELAKWAPIIKATGAQIE
jgi:tripartite-type tricarboxylate transporter receptor subunit TctC